MGGGEEVLYSCVVDAVPALYHQVMVWAWTAIDLAGVAPAQLVVHGMDGCDPRLRRDLERLGVRWIPSRPFPVGTPMCNKLIQLESDVLLAAGRVVLSDCDLAWRAPIDAGDFADRPRAKVVDLPNPPLELLEALFRDAGFGAVARSTVSLGGAPTYHNNCNGGLYLLSGEWLRRLREPWPRWLHWVDARARRLGRYAWHMFQIAFALAMEELGARVEHLPLGYNFPTHTGQGSVGATGIRALHFHRAVDRAGLLRPTGMPPVDETIATVNDVIRARAVDPWWHAPADDVSPAAPVAEDATPLATVILEGVHGYFRTRRHDHVTRQLAAYGAHTRNELAMVLSLLRPGDQVIDVGAHIGTFTVAFARAVGASGRVLSVEPTPDAFALLLDNLALNGLGEVVRARCALVTDRCAAHRAVRAPGHTSATYYVPTDDGTPVACLRLDALAEDLAPRAPLRLVKIDVEGMELSVLRSGRQLLAHHRPLLYLEVVPEQLGRYATTVDEIDALLSALDYRFFRNVGPRNSTGDDFRIAPLATLADGGAFFDCLAVPAEHLREELAPYAPAAAGV